MKFSICRATLSPLPQLRRVHPAYCPVICHPPRQEACPRAMPRISSPSSSLPRGIPSQPNHCSQAEAAAAAKSLQSCPTLCDPIDGSPPGFSVPGILQARTLEWVAIFFSNAYMHAKLLQSCPTLCEPMDSSPPGSSVHRFLQARILEWVAISFSSLWPYMHVCMQT